MSGQSDGEPRRVVGLRYERDGADAPRVVAKGSGELARQILERARASGVPIHHDPDLVALLSASPLGAEIPADVYEVVARLLAWLWSLRAPAAGDAQPERAVESPRCRDRTSR